MEPIEVARKLVGFGEAKDACRAYELVLSDEKDPAPDEKMEAAMYVLQFGGDYRLAYKGFLELNQAGQYVEDTRAIMTEAFYLPNEKLLRSHYENNIKQLKKYPYLFKKDFVPFEELPIRFYPFDDNSYVPYHVDEDKFEDITDYKDPVISRNFFHDLEKPILAEDVYSQYELEYLNDNVRPSEYVSRDNHIYLHYKSWAEFCAYLQVLNFRKMLIDQKFVFLIEDEIAQYPVDFKERFGIDYSTFPLKPVGIREIQRLIWHVQLSYHNGGDFFNEIMDGHPNLICSSSIFCEMVDGAIEDLRSTLNDARNIGEIMEVFDNGEWENLDLIRELYFMRDRTDKDILVAVFCCNKNFLHDLHSDSRIAPAILYQPHFSYALPEVRGDDKGRAIFHTEQYDMIVNSAAIKGFKYVKTFAPLRRITTSYGATVRFMHYNSGQRVRGCLTVVMDEVVERTLFRGYLVDGAQRLFKDSVVVRFEDGKLNPKATLSALAAFLDIPYTETMTYCSSSGVQMDEIIPGNVQGFDPAAVYRTYDDFAGDAERCWLEYFLRDAYEYYGYDFQYYDGGPVDEEQVKEWISHFDTLNHYMRLSQKVNFGKQIEKQRQEEPGKEYETTIEEETEEVVEEYMRHEEERRLSVARLLLRGLRFVNEEGQPLKMMPKLKLDPALLEQPLYR